MKRLIFTFALLLASCAAIADNYFTMGDNDTLLVSPALRGGVANVMVNAHFDGRLDYWSLTMYFPDGLSFMQAKPKSGMAVQYYDVFGDTIATYNAEITLGLHDSTVIASYIPVYGYWDYNHDGVFEPYGTVKWEAGDHNPMFLLNLDIDDDFPGGVITLNGLLNSGYDARGGTINGTVRFHRLITVRVGYKLGDVNGDGYININDVTALVNYLLTDEGLDQYQLEAADFNQDGYVNINDVTAIQAYLANSPQGMEPDGTSPE